MSKNILVVFYSHSGNTRKIAGLIQQQTGGSLFEIEPVAPYPTSYNAVVEQAKKEIQAGVHPKLRGTPEDIEKYDTVIVGSPNWWSTIAPPIATFLSECDLGGKTVIPFCTHGGGGVGEVETDIAAMCPQSVVKPGIVVSGSGGKQTDAHIGEWLRKAGVAG